MDVQELSSMDEEMAVIEKAIEDTRILGRKLRVLEAGCGQRWTLEVRDLELVGLDADETALKMRVAKFGDLDEAIHGDVVEAMLPDGSFDVVYCAFVLEHVAEADRAIANFSRWLRPGGLMVLRIPDRESARGFVTRHTPHWIHVAYYRYALKAKNAGEPGFAPYPTHYHPSLSVRNLVSSDNLDCRIEGIYGDGGYQPYGRGVIAKASLILMRFAAVVSFGRLTADHVNLLILMRKG